ncbi:MAG: hypothetical protein ACLP3C_33445 [Mycobacterium sp.]|uniref:hypothetical protein n=1 Tax=Mycobacterium sp. TaxID=1785 RepID=UPI003F9C3F0B
MSNGSGVTHGNELDVIQYRYAHSGPSIVGSPPNTPRCADCPRSWLGELDLWRYLGFDARVGGVLTGLPDQLLDLNHDELGRLQRCESDQDIDDSVIDVGLSDGSIAP